MSRRVPAVAPKSRRQIDNESVEFLTKHFSEHLEIPGRLPVLKCFDLLSDYGLDPGVAELSEGDEGISYPDGRVLLSEKTYRGAHAGNGRDRFTVVHECYHGLYHRHQIQHALVHQGTIVLARRGELPAYRDPEWQANVFAASALMPESMVKMVVARHSTAWERIQQVASIFGVSEQSARIRLTQLGLI